MSEIEVKHLYSSLDDDFIKDIGFPGQVPFTRGIYPSMYRGRLWTMRQYAGFGTAEESNRRFRYLLSHGQTGLSVAFDLPTQMGYDPDDPWAKGEVGRVGVSIASLNDMMLLFKGIPLDKVSVSMTINATAAVLLAMYLAVAEERGIPFSALNGTIQNDILKEYVARGTYIFPPRPSMRLITDIFAYCGKQVPRWNTISISGYHIREAGATAVQELAYTFSDAIAYVEAANKAGLAVDDFAPRLSFFFAVHNNLIEEVAKFRAGRRLWARIMKERFGAKDPRSLMMRCHAQTSGATLTAQQPNVNIVRVGLQALAGVLGGVQSLHTNSLDEACALPTEETAKLALRTQQIIAGESGVANVVDPLGGSYAVEALTSEIEKRARREIERIDSMGGAVSAIERGYIQKEIHESAFAFQKRVESQEQIIVGVNAYRTESPSLSSLLKVDPRVERRQIHLVVSLRKRRNAGKVSTALSALKEAASGTENLMPLILNAVRARATLGEISHALREVFGEHDIGTHV